MTASSMLAGVYRDRGVVRAERLAIPEPGRDEVRLSIEACGLCGSDLHTFHSGPDRVEPGMTLGHEMVGVIDLVGDGVEGFRAGDRVTVEPLLSCGHCDQCAAGFDNRCPEYGLIGLHRPGGFAERVIVPARRLYRVPAALDPCVAALAEPVAVVVHALRLARFVASEPLLVLGAGTIGQLAVAVAKIWGARDIAITARHPHQARLARELGATATLDPASIRPRAAEEGAAPGGAAAAIAIARGGVGGAFFPLVVETVGGRADTLLDAGVAVGPGGRVVVLGVFQEMVRLDPWPLLLKETTLVWSLCYRRDAVATPAAAGADFVEAVRLLAAHPDLFARVLTHRVPLAEIDRAFALADDKSSGAVKVSVTP
jgi:threonine dehydrogenase-like Zn-dependent dehydrogenase